MSSASASQLILTVFALVVASALVSADETNSTFSGYCNSDTDCKDGATCFQLEGRICQCPNEDQDYDYELKKCVKDPEWCYSSANCTDSKVCCREDLMDVLPDNRCMDAQRCSRLGRVIDAQRQDEP